MAFSLAAALALSVDWGTSDSEEGLDNPNSDDLGSDFGDTTLLYWYQLAEKGELYQFQNTKAGATSYEDLDSQEQAVQHANKNKEMYQRMVALAYGSVCSIYYVSILTALIGPVYKVVKGTVQVGVAPLKFIRQPKVTARIAKANVLKFIKYARRYRNIFTAASAAAGAVAGAGVGGIVTGLVSFILGSAALWVVEYILTRSGAAAKALEWMVYRMLEMDYNNTEILGFNVADTIAAAGGFTDSGATEIVNSVTGDEETEVVSLTRDLLTNPQVDDADIDAINVLTPSAVSPGTNGSTAGPASTGGDANSQIRNAVDDILK